MCSMCQKSDTCVKMWTPHWCFQYIDLLKDNFDMNFKYCLFLCDEIRQKTIDSIILHGYCILTIPTYL